MKTVLIVEDDIFLIKAYQAQFKTEQINTIFANDGEDALTKLASQPIDAIILDLVMPNMTGLEFLKTMRADQKNAKIPVIVATNQSSKSDQEGCEKYNISAFFIKSDVSIADIAKQIQTILKK